MDHDRGHVLTAEYYLGTFDASLIYSVLTFTFEPTAGTFVGSLTINNTNVPGTSVATVRTSESISTTGYPPASIPILKVRPLLSRV